jgi:hypothetical protein
VYQDDDFRLSTGGNDSVHPRDLKEPNAFDMSSTIRRTSAIQKLVTLSETLTPKDLVTNDNVALPSTP